MVYHWVMMICFCRRVPLAILAGTYKWIFKQNTFVCRNLSEVILVLQREKTCPLTRAPNEDSNQSWLSKQRPLKVLIRLHECEDWSESLLGAHVRRYFFDRCGSFNSKWISNNVQSNSNTSNSGWLIYHGWFEVIFESLRNVSDSSWKKIF